MIGLTLTAAVAAAIFASAQTPTAVAFQTKAHTPHSNTYKVDSRDIVLAPGKGIEVMYHIEKGATMVYSWKANDVVIFEFHGEPDVIPANAPKGYYESHEKDDAGRNQSHGTFLSPSTGIHGWYWKNGTQREVTIHLATAGFYDGAKEFTSGGQKDLPVQDAK
jgi:hypothetical protein